MAGKPLTPEQAEQERLALEYRKAGYHYDVIADKLHLANKGAAWKVVQRALRRMVKEPAEDVRALELARLDDLLLGVWDRAKRGDVLSIDRVLRMQERRAELQGLDAPQKRQIGGDPDNMAPILVRRYVGVDVEDV